jgi:hypothetical protein
MRHTHIDVIVYDFAPRRPRSGCLVLGLGRLDLKGQGFVNGEGWPGWVGEGGSGRVLGLAKDVCVSK